MKNFNRLNTPCKSLKNYNKIGSFMRLFDGNCLQRD